MTSAQARLLAEGAEGVAPIDGIRVGIGGWTYVPWRSNFYPSGLVQRRELAYASRHLSAIEVNGTYYGAQKPATYARWRDETPPGFVFSAKAPKRITQSRSLASTRAQVDDFIGDISALGDRLGPLVWQFTASQHIEPEDFQAFLALLPREDSGRRLRHVIDVRDPAFVDGAFIALLRQHDMAAVVTDSPEHPNLADVTSDFVYARLMASRSDLACGYPQAQLQAWAAHARAWSSGATATGLPLLADPPPPGGKREVFVFFIAAAKERNPAAALALLEILGRPDA